MVVNRLRTVPQAAATAAVADLPYLCTRVWGMCPRLLIRREFEDLRSLKRPGEMFDLLMNTEYEGRLKVKALDVEDVAEVENCLQGTFCGRVERVQKLVQQCAPPYVYLVTGQWDLHHMRALVRGVVSGADPELMDDAFVGVGAFTTERFREASRSKGLAELAARVGQWHPALAESLAPWVIPGNEEEPPLRDMELALERFHVLQLFSCAERGGEKQEASVVRQLAALYVDITNVTTALRFLEHHLARDEVRRLYLPDGHISLRSFEGMLDAEDIEQIYGHAGRGPVSKALERGILYFVNVGRPSVFERFFDEQRLHFEKRLARSFPLSIAVPVYYLTRIRNELINLRLIVRQIRYRLPPGAVQEKLVYA